MKEYSGPVFMHEQIGRMIADRRHIDIVFKPHEDYSTIVLKDSSRAVIAVTASPETVSLEKMAAGHHRTVPIILVPKPEPTIEDAAEQFQVHIHDFYQSLYGYPIRFFQDQKSRVPLLEIRITNGEINMIRTDGKLSDVA